MAASDPLIQFVRDALIAGRSRADIRTALETAGWPDKEIATALAAFSEVEFTPPVPRPRVQPSTRETFISMLLFTAMVFSVIYVMVLGHGLVDLWLADSDDETDQAMASLYWPLAVLMIMVPAFIGLTWYTRAARDANDRRSLPRKRLTYLALFLSALTFSMDAIWVIYAFLSDGITLHFLLDAGVVAVVSGTVFLFYLRGIEDIKPPPVNRKPGEKR